MTSKTLLTAAVAAAIATGPLATTPAAAGGPYYRNNGVTAVWVNIKAFRGEGLWEACRRIYQRDVYQVRRGKSGQVRCKIDHSRIYDYSERYQNFN